MNAKITLIASSACFLLLAGCDSLLPKSDQVPAETASTEGSVDEVTPPAATPTLKWIVSNDAGVVAASIRARRGAIRTVNEDGSSLVSVDIETADAPYVAFSFDELTAAQLTGRELVVEIDAASPAAATLEIQYHTLNGGGSPLVPVKLTPNRQTHRLVLTPPVENPPLDTDELRIKTVEADGAYTLSGLRIGYFE